MQLNVDASDLLWILFSDGGDSGGGSSSSVFAAALRFNHWKTIAAVLGSAAKVPERVTKEVARRFFEVELRDWRF